MPQTRSPRKGSMQFWPRKRASRHYANIKAYPVSDKAGLLSFAGYKVGMTQIITTQTLQLAKKKTQRITVPVTVIETPPLKIYSVRFYKKSAYGEYVYAEVANPKVEKELGRKVKSSSKKDFEQKISDMEKNIDAITEIRVNVYTKPKAVPGTANKKPELFETALGGSVKDQLDWVKENINAEISVGDVVKEGSIVDFHAITTGRGFQGPVKRFGIGFTSHKSEKKRRTPGTLGGWKAQGHFMYRVPYPGQKGFHKRVDHNKQILKISDDVAGINVEGGYKGYGEVKNTYVLVKGSIPGPSKRLVRFKPALRTKTAGQANINPILNVSKTSVQG